MTISPDNTLRSRAGFSLLELVLVLSAVATLAAMAAPRYAEAVSRYRVDVAARRVAADLNLARNRARSGGAEVIVTFSTAADEYTIPGLGDLKHPSRDYRLDLAGEPYMADLVSADFAGGASVAFDAYGAPDNGGRVVVQAGALRRTIVLDANTGKAKVQ